MDWLALAGLVVIIGGCALVAMGFVSLWIYARRAAKSSKPRRPVRPPIVLLLLNFPVCALYLAVAITVGFASFLTIENGLALPIDEVTLTDASGKSHSFGSIPPGDRTFCVSFFPEGPLRYNLSVGNQERSGVLTGYVSGLERRYELAISQGLQVSVDTDTTVSSVPEYVRNCLFD